MSLMEDNCNKRIDKQINKQIDNKYVIIINNRQIEKYEKLKQQ